MGDNPLAVASGLSPIQADKPWYNCCLDHSEYNCVMCQAYYASNQRKKQYIFLSLVSTNLELEDKLKFWV